MSEFFFQIGRNPQLSIFEISKIFPGAKISNKIFPGDLVTVNFSEKISFHFDFLKFFGGTIRIAEKISDTPEFKKIPTILAEELSKNYQQQKINFAISVLGKNFSENFLRRILIETKKKLRSKKIPVRFANRNFQNFSTTQFWREKNLQEFLLTENFLLKTISSQNPKQLAEKEFGKPQRSMKIGMSSSKLSKLLINFSRDKNGKLPISFWDPFCGTGSIPIEAAEMGIEKIIASDISEQSLQITKENFSFFQPNKKSNLQIFPHDITKKLTKKIEAETIITESFLGPLFSASPSGQRLFSAQKLCQKILQNFFQNISENFTGKKIIIAIPFWLTKSKHQFLEEIFPLVEKNWKNLGGKNLLFFRSNQFVGRQILVLEKK